jgi:hypothetical protein
MNIIRVVQGLLLGTMLTLSACGGPVPVDQPSEAIGQRQDAIILPCDGTKDYRYSYYSDASKTQLVGDRQCYCDGSTSQWGRVTAYYTFSSISCGAQ